MRPWRPAELFRQAFIPTPGHDVAIGREAERFREHFASEDGVVKVGPWYALRRWFVPRLPLLTEDDYVLVPFSGTAIRWAEMEAEQRMPFMVQRNPSADIANRHVAAIQGFRVQKHVADWFKGQFPNLFQYAPNEGNIRQACPYDFVLSPLNGVRPNSLQVDVVKADEGFPLRFRLHAGKMRGANCMIVAYDNEAGVLICGYTREPQYGGVCGASHVMPIERLIVLLNIVDLGLDYRRFVNEARR